MARIRLEPTSREFFLHRDEYDALVAELRAQGHEVELAQTLSRKHLGTDQIYDLVVYVADEGKDVATKALLAWLGKRLLGRIKGRRAQVRTDGDPPREIDLPGPFDQEHRP